jgi:hypothetical protein
MELTPQECVAVVASMLHTPFVYNNFSPDVVEFATTFITATPLESMQYLSKHKENKLGIRYLHMPVSKTWHFLEANLARTMKVFRTFNTTITYGQTQELDALAIYQRQTGLTVKRCQHVINPNLPIFSGSPDGLLFSSRGTFMGAIEVKTIPGIRSPKDYYKLREFLYINNTLILKPGSKIFDQVQVMMAILGLLHLEVVVYFVDVKKIKGIQVLRDDKYLSQILPKLHAIYNQEMLPLYKRLTRFPCKQTNRLPCKP